MLPPSGPDSGPTVLLLISFHFSYCIIHSHGHYKSNKNQLTYSPLVKGRENYMNRVYEATMGNPKHQAYKTKGKRPFKTDRNIHRL